MKAETTTTAAPAKAQRPAAPATALRFSPTAWAKLLFLRDAGKTEIGAFGITRADDLLYVQDVQTVLHYATAVSIDFDDTAVADFVDTQVDAGRKPEQFLRVWVHTHPGDSPIPSGTDEETFARVFGVCQWSVMFILAKGGKTYARLRFSIGPQADVLLPVDVDYRLPFSGSAVDTWKAEYDANVKPDAGFPDFLSADVLQDVADIDDQWFMRDDWSAKW